ncbi:MAG: DUF4369 domain-containing protein [Bacteroidales bacterium]|nr:DUF4369 domain-containing protein [Bacteroidales bacterium]
MLKRTGLSLMLLLTVASCRDQGKFKITGIVPDKLFEGSTVYLVALDAPVTRNVDSTVIRNGEFRFETKADSLGVKILRIQAKYPDIIEDLVVVTETGTLRVVLGFKSSGQGTRLNDKMQEWKERKHFNDSVQLDLFTRKNAKGLSGETLDSLLDVSLQMNKIFFSDVERLIEENLFNGIGLLLFKLYYDALPATVKNHVIEQTGMRYFESDAELMRRVN